MTLAEILKKHPWMRHFKSRLQKKCHDCGAKLGEPHSSGCDTARCLVCGGQRLCCSCEGGDGDIWTGLMYPDLHRICFEQNLWCKDQVWENGKWRDVDEGEIPDLMRENKQIRWHVPCSPDDPHKRADINRAAVAKKEPPIQDGDELPMVGGPFDGQKHTVSFVMPFLNGGVAPAGISFTKGTKQIFYTLNHQKRCWEYQDTL